jgi:hypothetical protein
MVNKGQQDKREEIEYIHCICVRVADLLLPARSFRAEDTFGELNSRLLHSRMA